MCQLSIHKIICICALPVTEERVESKNDDSDSEEQARTDASPAVASQPQRIALFPGVDPSALKVSFIQGGRKMNPL